MKKRKLMMGIFYSRIKKLTVIMGISVILILLAGFSSKAEDNSSGTKVNTTSQQQSSAKGKVLDDSGQPLPGVTVVVKGTTNGTVTDVDGVFTIANVANGTTLVFSFIGMSSQEVVFNGQSSIDITMEMDAIGIEEVIAVGYGTQRRSEITGSIASIKGADLVKMPVGDIGKSLTGMAAGLKVFDVDGDVGREPVISIRGETFISRDGDESHVLIVIDGTPGGSLRDVAPEDIESIEILKDAAAAAIYGSRGANGVILITTKRGQVGRMKVSIDSYFRYNLQTSKHQFARPYDELMMIYEGQILERRDKGPDLLEEYNNYEWVKGVNDEFQDMYRDTWSNRQRINISGGSKEHQFRLSGTMYDDVGTQIGNSYKQGTFIFASDHQITDWFKWSNTFTYRKSTTERGRRYDPMRRMLDTPFPYIKAMGKDNPEEYYAEEMEKGESWADVLESARNSKYSDKYTFNINPKIQITKGLELSDRFTYRTNSEQESSYVIPVSVMGWSSNKNEAELEYDAGWDYVNDVILNYRGKFFDKHSIYATAVWSVEESFDRSLEATRQGLTMPGMLYALSLGDIATATNGDSYAVDTRVGLVARAGYTYDDRYVIAGSVRRDASSRFSPDNRWGTFPSASFAWNIHNEEFMQNVSWLSNAKIRGSWGQLGRDKLGRYQIYPSVSLDAGYAFGNSITAGGTINDLAYAGTGWEAVETTDLALESYFFENRLKFLYSYWVKTTKEMIFEKELPKYAGFGDNEVAVNAGELYNNGHEFEIEWRDKKGEFKYNISANLSTYYSELTEWVFPEGVEREENVRRKNFAIEEGHPYMFHYVLQTDGLWTSDAQIDAAKYHEKNDDGEFLYNDDGTPNWGWPSRGRGRPYLGEIKFADRNGDGNIDSKDKYYAGQRYPSIMIGINGGFEYKGFDFYVQTNANMGNQIYIEIHSRNANAFGKGGEHVDVSGYGAWTGEGSPNLSNYPALTANGGNNEITQFADHAIYDADYFRIKAANIGYTFRQDFLKRFGISKLRVYASGYNLFTFTSFPGFDPELGSDVMHDSYSLAGFQRPYPYTNPKSFSGGVQIDF
jgi:TonB-linked SusC/RagA family outer membrane protein